MGKLALLCAAAVLALGGCSAVSTLADGGSLAQSAPQIAADAQKALAVAHLAYSAAGIAMQQAIADGLLKGANAAKAQDFYAKAGAALAAADAANAAANAQGMVAALADAAVLVAQLHALMAAK